MIISWSKVPASASAHPQTLTDWWKVKQFCFSYWLDVLELQTVLLSSPCPVVFLSPCISLTQCGEKEAVQRSVGLCHIQRNYVRLHSLVDAWTKKGGCVFGVFFFFWIYQPGLCFFTQFAKKIPFMAALTLSTFCQLFYFVAAHLNHGTLSNSLSISKVCNFLCLLPSVILGSRIFAEFQQASEP